MRCLMCNRNKSEAGLKDILFGDDPLCSSCRNEWDRRKIRFRFEGVKLESSYVYNEAFSRCLIQYKELGDEALKGVFLYEVRQYLRMKYHGYTLVLMPSSKEKIQERGFHHLREMFLCLGMEMIEPFEKISDFSQKERNAALRRNVAHEIRLKPQSVLPEKILLCDDTITTGSTLKGALSQIDCTKHKVRIYAVSANYRWLAKKRYFIAF